MPFEELTVCSKNQVRKTVKRFGATHLLSLLDFAEHMATPQRIKRGNHLSVNFDDVNSHDLENAPSSKDVHKIISWVERLPNDARIVIHCTAGISRSTAVGYSLLCGQYSLEVAANLLMEIRPEARPNFLITYLFDEALNMNGKLNDIAQKTWG